MFSIIELNSQQRDAVQAPDGPTMVLGGPDCGKTRVLTHRIAHLLQLGVCASQIMILLRTNNEVDEMKSIVFHLVGEKSKNLCIGTFRTVFARVLRRNAEVVGYQSNFSIYDTVDSINLIKSIMKSLSISIQQFAPQEILSRISSAKNQVMTSEEFFAPTSDMIAQCTIQIFDEYQKTLRLCNAMDSDELVLKSIEMFTNAKNILTWYQDRIRFLLIDDFQDISRPQYTLSRFLVGKSRNIFVVGDELQFSNALTNSNTQDRIEFYSDFPGANIIRLEQNYRSTRTVIDATNQVIQNNLNWVSKNQWTENPQGDLITILKCEDDGIEASTIVKYIFKESHRLKIDLKDFLIIYRTDEQLKTLEGALDRSQIPYVLMEHIGFYQRNEIKDVLAYFRILTNESDDQSFLRILSGPIHGIDEVALNAVIQFAFSSRITISRAVCRVNEIIKLSPTVKGNLIKLVALQQKYKQLMKKISFCELSRAIVDELGILQILKEKGTSESMKCRRNIQKLLSNISEFSELQPDATLENYLEDVSFRTHTEEDGINRNGVTLAKSDNSKGLEFPVVFIVGAEEGLLPFYSNAIGEKDLKKERRFFYISMSRAMKKLYITSVLHRCYLGQIRCQTPSRFLNEINPNLLEIIDLGKQRGPLFENNTAMKQLERRNSNTVSSQLAFNSSDTRMINLKSNYTKSIIDTGKLVEHSSFGKGRVLSVSGKGDSQKVVVEFMDMGKKDLLLKYANLKVI